jgi:GDP-L-fucose synthase
MKVVVLGGTGFLGANVVETFRRAGHDAEPCSRRTGVDARQEHSLTQYMERVRPELVVNCAAHVGGIAYNEKCPVAIYEDNLLLGFAILRASYRTGVRKLVNIMPNCTYPGEMELYSESRWWDGPMHPTVLTYGMPRKAIWVQAWAYQKEHGFRSIHLVLPNLYGPRDHFDPVRSHALGALISKVIEAQKNGLDVVEVWGSGRPVREWMYVEDAADGILRAAERYDDLDVLNVGSGTGCSIAELAAMIGDLAGWKGKFVFNTSRPDGAPRKILDVAKMRRALDGWCPATGLRDGIAKTIEWCRVNRQEHSRPGVRTPVATL